MCESSVVTPHQLLRRISWSSPAHIGRYVVLGNPAWPICTMHCSELALIPNEMRVCLHFAKSVPHSLNLAEMRWRKSRSNCRGAPS